MSKQLSHIDWMSRQFDVNGLRTSYRNVILHASIIEGTLRKISKKSSFQYANKFLRNNKKITHDEFNTFEEVRKIRNKLIHDSFKDALTSKQIESLRNDLRKRIIDAYKISKFLDDKIFKKYGIQRITKIKLTLPA